MSAPPAAPIVLASTSPQRRAILEQLGIPFEVVAPRYEEPPLPSLGAASRKARSVKGSDPANPGFSGSADPTQMVCRNARGKARSVADLAGDRPVLGVDTTVVCGGRAYGKPGTAEDAAEMVATLAGKTHAVLSGLCLVTPGWEVVEHEVTHVAFRPLTPRDVAAYVASGEWEGRAGAYAIQGLGASLVERIEGDYLNVVGLPAALLVRLLAERYPGVYGFG